MTFHRPSLAVVVCVVYLTGALDANPFASGDESEEPARPAAPVNLDLEGGATDGVPDGWRMPQGSRDKGFSVTIAEDDPARGKRCVLISREADARDGFGNLMQSIDAGAYRGRRVRFSAWVRTEVDGRGNQAQLWFRVDRAGDQRGFFNNMDDRPITGNGWAEYEILAEVAHDAVSLNFGVFLLGSGKAWFDAASLEVLGEAGVGNQPPRELSEPGLRNLVALTRLIGYVRYFHPSDEAAATDWEAFAIAAADRVENALDPVALATALAETFHYVAPGVQVHANAGRRDSAPSMTPPADAGAKLVSWRHLGVGTGSPRSIYSSTRVNAQDEKGEEEGFYYQSLPAGDYLGKRVRLRGSARAALRGPGDAAKLALIVIRANGQRGFSDEMEANPIVKNEWADYEINGTVDNDAQTILLAMVVRGEGQAWFGDVTFETVDEAGKASVIRRTDFAQERDKSAPEGWNFNTQATKLEFEGSLISDCPGANGACTTIVSRPPTRPDLPAPDQPLTLPLGASVTAKIPLTLFRTADGTFPRPGREASAGSAMVGRPEGWLPSGNDRATRLAGVMLAWNVFQHFYPYFDVVDADWDRALEDALRSAAADGGEREFLETLRRMVARLRDGHGNVYHPVDSANHAPPILWDWVEERLVVTEVSPTGAEGLTRGDVVLRIDGVPAKEALERVEASISGATPQWIRYRGLLRLLAGQKDEPCVLDVRSHAGAERTVTLLRTSPLRGDGALKESRPQTVAEPRPGVFYVDIDRVTSEELTAALPDLAQAHGVVFDLRGYPRHTMTEVIQHLIDQPVTCARWLVPIVYRPDRERMEFDFSNWSVEPRAPRIAGKVVFLTDGRAISAAETFLGIIEHYRLAEIVGGPTAGTNGNVNPFTLPGGYRLSWTGMKVLKHDGSRHHGVGIQPTFRVERTVAGVAAGRDEVLLRGLEIAGAR